MAGPQLEDGYTRVANEIFDHIMRAPLNGTQFRIVLAVWRFTYGYNRKDHCMSIDFIAEAIDAHSDGVKRELKNLIDKRVLLVTREAMGVRPRAMSFNKKYDEWCKPLGGADSPPLEQMDLLEGADSPPLEGANPPPLEGDDLPPKKDKRKKDNIYNEIISYLNLKTGKRFSAKVKNTKDLINGRLSEGRTLEDFIYVIDTKCSHWMDNPKMFPYLRPGTLFRPSKFDEYLNQQPITNEQEEKSDRDNQIAYDDALREWVMAGHDPGDFRFDE